MGLVEHYNFLLHTFKHYFCSLQQILAFYVPYLPVVPKTMLTFCHPGKEFSQNKVGSGDFKCGKY